MLWDYDDIHFFVTLATCSDCRVVGGCWRKKGVFYRMTHQVVQILPLTSKQKFCFGLAWPGLARPKLNFCFEIPGRFCTT